MQRNANTQTTQTMRSAEDTVTTIMLDSLNRPSNKTVLYLADLARQFGGKFENVMEATHKGPQRFYLVYSFSCAAHDLAEEFWERAVAYQDFMEESY
jgi:hypothetical protein